MFVNNCQWVCILRYSRVNKCSAAVYKQDSIAQPEHLKETETHNKEVFLGRVVSERAQLAIL